MNKLLGIILFVFLLGSCKNNPVATYDFEEIKSAGELTIITLSSSTSYFIYKDEPMGYDYDLAKDFCNFHGLKLNIKVAQNSTKLLEMLANGEGDLIASPVPVQTGLKDSVLYCGLEQISHQVLVQRRDKKNRMVRDVTQLIDKEIYVKHDTKYHQRILNLDAELGNGIIIKDIEKDTITEEDLIAMVSHKEIDYTVADEYIAKLNKTYYSNIDISTPLSFDQRAMWAVRKTTPLLAQALNEWFSQNNKKPTYRATLKKYFELSKVPLEAYQIDFSKLPKGSISVFDPLFKKYASVTGYDWCLLAAIAYQESRFRTDLSSWAGAVGLMGLMPRTAAIYGIEGDGLKNPEMSVMAGANYIKYLDDLYSGIPDPQQRIKFVLAAYNGGHGHITDARTLANKHGDNPDIWDNCVEKYIELKSKPEYYNDPVVKYGYLRGTEVINYVSQVTQNWIKFQSSK